MATLSNQSAVIVAWNAFWAAIDGRNEKAARAAFNAFPRKAKVSGFGINEMHDALCTLELGR